MNGHFLSQTRKLNRHYQSGQVKELLARFDNYCHIGLLGDDIAFVPAPSLQLTAYKNEPKTAVTSRTTGVTFYQTPITLTLGTPTIHLQYQYDKTGAQLPTPLYAALWDFGEYDVEINPMIYRGTGGNFLWFEQPYGKSYENTFTIGDNITKPCLYPDKIRLIVIFYGYNRVSSTFVPSQLQGGTVEIWPHEYQDAFNNILYCNTGQSFGTYLNEDALSLIEERTSWGKPFDPFQDVRWSIPISQRPTFDSWLNTGTGFNPSSGITTPRFCRPISAASDYTTITISAGSYADIDLSSITNTESYQRRCTCSYTLGGRYSSDYAPSFGPYADNMNTGIGMFRNYGAEGTGTLANTLLVFFNTIGAGGNYSRIFRDCKGITVMALPSHLKYVPLEVIRYET